MNTQNQPIKADVRDFMLTEYETLRSIRSDVTSLGHSNVNFFLATISGAIVGLALFSQSSGLSEILPVITGVILASLFLLGIIIFARTVERDIGITIYARGMNRIRLYFTQLSPNIKEYLILPISDDIPSFKSVGLLPKSSFLLNLSGTIAVINSLIASTGILLLIKAVITSSIEQIVLVNTIAFVMFYFAQYRYLTARLREVEKQTESLFPKRRQPNAVNR
jgi:hypothetical protein